MTAPATIALQTAFCAALGAIARERARAYGLSASPTARTALAAAASFVPFLLSGYDERHALARTILAACAATSAATDLETGLIFDRVLIAAAALLLPVVACGGLLPMSLLGGGLGAALLWLPHALSRGRGIGLGDVKLAAVIGFALGPLGALQALCASAIAGGAVAFALLACGRARRGDRLRFGPFLAAGAAIALAGSR